MFRFSEARIGNLVLNLGAMLSLLGVHVYSIKILTNFQYYVIINPESPFFRVLCHWNDPSQVAPPL